MNKGRKEEKIGKAIIVAHQTKEGRKDDYYDDDGDHDGDGHLSRRASEHS